MLALAREQGFAPRAITLAFDEFRGERRDEERGARDLAAHYGVHHRVRRVPAAEFHADLPRLLAAMDQPSIDGVNAWFAGKAAAEWGLKVALSGLGGDELLGGYPSFRTVPWLVRLGAVPSRIPGLGRAVALAAAPGLRAAGLHPKLAGLLALGGRWTDAWLLRRGLFLPWELERVMPREEAREGLARLSPRGLLGTALESGAYLRNQLLRDADWAGMAHGVEVRTPLVDTRLLQALAPWLARRAAAAGKGVLAQVPARRLPADLARRPKTGFSVPLDAWSRGAGDATAQRGAGARGWALAVARQAFA